MKALRRSPAHPSGERVHRDLYQYTTLPAGRWKTIDNAIEEELPDGTRRVRVRTVPATETPAAMDELHRRFFDARDAGEHHPLLLIGAYVFDFLAIHPFRDGNGRLARLLTLLLLYQSGNGVGRYMSLERLVNDARAGYYDSLQAAGVGWHEDQHTIWPWLEYMLGILVAAYRSRTALACSATVAGLRRRRSSASSASGSLTRSRSPTFAMRRSAQVIR